MAVKDSPTPPRSPSGARRPDPQFEPPMMSVEGIRRGCLGSAASKIVLGLLLLIFAGGVVISGLGSNGFSGINGTGDLNTGGTGSATSNEAAASVGADSVTQGQLNLALANAIDQAQQYGYPIETAQLLFYRQNTLQGLSNRIALAQDAHKQGFNPSSDDIEKAITKDIDDAIKAQEGDNPTAYRRSLEANGKTIDGLRTEAIQKADRDDAAQKWAIDKLEDKVKADNKVTPQDYTLSQTKLNVQQIVIQPKPAQPAVPAIAALKGIKGSVAEPAKAAQPAETEEQARARAEKLMQQLGVSPSAAQFAALAKTQSDDLYTKAKGGDLGFKLPAQLGLPVPVATELMSPSNASKNLVGPLQDPATKYFYVLHITGRKLDLPKDYKQKKDQLFKAFEATRDNDAWQQYQEKVSKAAKVDVTDPAVLAYKAQNALQPTVTGAAADTARAGIIENYQAALTGASGKYAAAINSQLAQLYTTANQPDKAVEALTAATKSDPENVDAKLALVRALQNNKQTKEALAQLDQASQSLDRNPPQPSPFMMGGASSNPGDMMHAQIASLYDGLGKKALAKQERAKIKPPTPGGAPGGLGGIQGLPPGVKVLPAR